MKYISSQWALFLRERGVRRNMAYFVRFLLVLLAMIAAFSVIFHFIMRYEGRDYSWLTGLYWTLTVMSTLGFGDITFESDPGKLFSIVVLVSGVLCLLVMLPFAFIQYFYAPWLEAQKKKETPRSVPDSVKGHVILVGLGPITLNLADDLARYGYYCALLCGDTQTTLDLTDQGYHAFLGGYDDGETYRRLRVGEAAMLVAMEDDVRNTNIVFSAREVDSRVTIIARADKTESIDILELAGCSHVFQFRRLLGGALAGRVTGGAKRTCTLASFGPLVVAEAPTAGTSLAGKTLRETDLRRKMGINVVGVWERGNFRLPNPDEPLTEHSVLVMAGTEERMAAFDRRAASEASPSEGRVIVLGGGRVGLAAARELQQRGIDVVIVDKKPVGKDSPWPDGGRLLQVPTVRGDAADLAVLEQVGIRQAPAVIITTHDDDTNIYLTIYCRRLRPDMQIVSRATLDRNVGILHSAGADVVLSLASMITDRVLNQLAPGKVFLLNEGLNIFRTGVGRALDGLTLQESGIRAETRCSLVAVRDTEGVMRVNPEPDHRFQAGEELYLIGDSNAEDAYYHRFGHETGS